MVIVKSVFRILLAVLFIVAVAYGISVWSWHKGTMQANEIFNQMVGQEQQQLKQQESSLASNASQTYQGDGFSIQVPSGWTENTAEEDRWAASFGQSKVWGALNATLSGGYNTAHQELDVVWNTDTPNGPLNKAEAIDVSDGKNFPDQFTLSNPTIPGADKTVMSTPTKLYSDGYTIKLYVHAHGKIYFVEGGIMQGTDAQAAGLQKIIQSFKIL